MCMEIEQTWILLLFYHALVNFETKKIHKKQPISQEFFGQILLESNRFCTDQMAKIWEKQQDSFFGQFPYHNLV